jgi:hypothetical protein
VEPKPRHPRALLAITALGAATLCSAGCQNALFPEDEDRSQYAVYDRARKQTVSPYVEDKFGRRRPNLRGRLLIAD